jgi:hypothetical protein
VCVYAKGVSLHAGVVVAFQANQLPNPLVEVSVPGHPAYQVSAKHSLKPHFPTEHPARFARVSQDAAVTMRLFDDKAGRRNQLLGEAVLPCKHIKVRCSQASRSAGRSGFGKDLDVPLMMLVSADAAGDSKCSLLIVTQQSISCPRAKS